MIGLLTLITTLLNFPIVQTLSLLYHSVRLTNGVVPPYAEKLSRSWALMHSDFDLRLLLSKLSQAVVNVKHSGLLDISEHDHLKHSRPLASLLDYSEHERMNFDQFCLTSQNVTASKKYD